MKVDPDLIKQAKAEINALVDLGEINFPTEAVQSSGRDVFVGIKLKPSLYKWLKSRANYFTGGNVNGFIRSLLEEIKAKQENTHHASNTSRKRIPS